MKRRTGSRTVHTLHALIVLLGAWHCNAFARQPDGTLGLIRSPNNGIPAIAIPGTSFDVVLESQAALRLVGANGPCDLVTEWKPQTAGSLCNGHCTVPPGTPPGTYAIEATAGEKTDRTERAVFVRESFPEKYVVAHLTDTHLGPARSQRTPSEILLDAFKVTNGSEAAFVLITGDLTDAGDPAQFEEFLKALDTSNLPTFVTPGNHDRGGNTYARYFAPACYMFWFGKDGYLSFDTKDFDTADDLDAQNGDIEVFRRAIKSARWSVGFTHRYEPDMGMRCQIALFVDDPLDILLMGHVHHPKDDQEKRVPWGTTALMITPATVDGFARFIDVSAKGVAPRPPQRIATTE